jgi:hypothetical protein
MASIQKTQDEKVYISPETDLIQLTIESVIAASLPENSIDDAALEQW